MPTKFCLLGMAAVALLAQLVVKLDSMQTKRVRTVMLFYHCSCSWQSTEAKCVCNCDPSACVIYFEVPLTELLPSFRAHASSFANVTNYPHVRLCHLSS